MKLKHETIRVERIRKNYTQEYVADEIGISQSQYSRLEKGEISLDIEKVGKITKVLEISPQDIIEFSQENINVSKNDSDSLIEIKKLFEELVNILKNKE